MDPLPYFARAYGEDCRLVLLEGLARAEPIGLRALESPRVASVSPTSGPPM